MRRRSGLTSYPVGSVAAHSRAGGCDAACLRAAPGDIEIFSCLRRGCNSLGLHSRRRSPARHFKKGRGRMNASNPKGDDNVCSRHARSGGRLGPWSSVRRTPLKPRSAPNEQVFTSFANRLFTSPLQNPEHDRSRAFRETCRRPVRRRRLTPALYSGSRLPAYGNPGTGFAADHLNPAGRVLPRLWRGRWGASWVLFDRRVSFGGRAGTLQHPQQYAGRQRSGRGVPISTQRIGR